MTAHHPQLRPPAYEPPTISASWQYRVNHDPGGRCLEYFDGALTVAEVDAASSALAAAFVARSVRPGDRIGISLQNIPHFPIAMLAVWRVGGIVVPLNPMNRERELHTVLAAAGCVGLICGVDTLRVAAAAAPGTALAWALVADDADFQQDNDPRVFAAATTTPEPLELAPFPVSTVAAELDRFAGKSPAAVRRVANDVAMLSFTSGTTGPPKGAEATHRSILLVARNFVSWAELDAGDRMLALAPLFHITGSVIIGIATLISRGCLVLPNRPQPEVVLEAFSRHGVTVAVAPITMYTALLELPQATESDFASVRHLFTGGAPVPPAKVAAFEQRFGHYILNAYGLTESNAGVVGVPPGERAPVHEPTGTLSVGRAMEGMTLRVLDDTGAEVPAGTPGELELSGDLLASGYWREPTETAAAFPGGRLRTGDIAIIDAEGWVYIIDRSKDQINSSGYKVWPREVEDVLYEHPAVREVAVIGVVDAYRGEAVHAYVSLSVGHTVTEAELIGFARDRLAVFKSPRRVWFIDDLPKTPTGKIRRRDLRERANAERL